MTAQKIAFFCVALVFLGLFTLIQRQVVSATEAGFRSQAIELERGQQTLFTVAAAKVLDPEFFDKPAFHSPITIDLATSGRGDESLDQVAEIRAAYDLSQRLDHNAILERHLSNVDFGRGCRGIDAARLGLTVGTDTSTSFTTVALAALLKDPQTLTTEPSQLKAAAVSLAKELTDGDHLSGEVLLELQNASATAFEVSGNCTP